MQRSNSKTDDDIFFDMDGLDTGSHNNMPKMTQSDDEDYADNDEIELG